MGDWRPTPAARKVIREIGLEEPGFVENYGNPISTMGNPVEKRLSRTVIALAEHIALTAPESGDE